MKITHKSKPITATQSLKVIQKPPGKLTENGKKNQFTKNKLAAAGVNSFSKNTKPNFHQKSKVGPGGDTKQLEKPDWSKFKQDKKDLRLKRKESRDKDLFKLNIEAKRLYEQLKCKNTKEKSELAPTLYNLLSRSKSIQKFVLAHDTSRIIQCLLKYSPPKLREQLSADLIPISVEMATSRYAHFCILRMLKYGSNATKVALVDSFFGSILKLVTHNISSKIIDKLYFDVANKKQKTYMRQELYSDLYINTKDDSVKKLSDIFKDSIHMKNGFLNAIKAKLEHVANKQMAENSLVHAVLLEYLDQYTNEPEISEECMEIVRIYSGMIPHLVTTRDGCLAATWCFWLSSTKERRGILKSLKEHLDKIFMHEHGHLFVTAIINTMDDTKAIKKILFDPILANLDQMIQNQWARKLIQWFVSPADTQCFHPQLIKYLDCGLKYSKKDKPLRVQEIFQQIENPICDAICAEPTVWMSNGHIGLLTATIVKQVSSENSQRVFEALAQVVCDKNWKIETNGPDAPKISGIEDSGMHIVLKKMLKTDETRNKNNEISFGTTLMLHLTENVVLDWLQYNRGCFILLIIYETSLQKTKNELRTLLYNISAVVKSQVSMGAKLLADKLGL